MERLVTALHVGTAIFLIGPLTLTTLLTPRAVRHRETAVVEVLSRWTRILGFAVLAVFAVGLWLVPVSGQSFDRFWLSASMTLFIVGLGLLHALVLRDQRAAVARLRAGSAATEQAARIAGVSVAVAVLWVVILALMFWRPGA